MKINAVIESRDGGTLVLDFPRSIYDVYEKLQSVGIRKSPHQIALCDEECDDVRVKLYSEDEVGKHLLLTLNEQNSLADANMLVFMVDNAKADFRSKLEQNLLHDQYSSMQEVTDDIKQMLYESGPVKAVFYCPLVGEVTDDEGFSYPVDGRFLKSCLLFPFKDDVELDVGKLAMWRLQTHGNFGGTWLSDYVPNKLGGFISKEQTAEAVQKPDCPLIGQDGNIFNLMGIASRTLKQNGLADQAKKMCDRIRESGDYYKALGVIGEYVNITSVDDAPDEGEDFEEGMGMQL